MPCACSIQDNTVSLMRLDSTVSLSQWDNTSLTHERNTGVWEHLVEASPDPARTGALVELRRRDGQDSQENRGYHRRTRSLYCMHAARMLHACML